MVFFAVFGLIILSLSLNLFLLFQLRRVYRFLAEMAYLIFEHQGYISFLTGNSAKKDFPHVNIAVRDHSAN